METLQINLKKYRDFGQLITDTFVFIKQEYKLLLRVILTYVGPFVLITAFAGAWMQTGLFSSMNPENITAPFDLIQNLGIKYGLYAIATLISTTMLLSTVYSFMYLYSKNGKDGFTQEDVWEIVKEKFFSTLRVLGLGILLMIGIGIFIGLTLWLGGINAFTFIFSVLFCVFLVVYLAVIFTLIFSTSQFENLKPFKAFERSQFLIKDDFWFALGIGFVMSLIAGMLGGIFLAPSSILSFFIILNNVKGESSQSFSMIFLVLNAAGTFCASIIYGVPHITMTMFYFSQVEKKESPNLINKIDKINNPETE